MLMLMLALALQNPLSDPFRFGLLIVLTRSMDESWAERLLGIVPLRQLSSRARPFSLVSFPNEEGIAPEIAPLPKSISSNVSFR